MNPLRTLRNTLNRSAVRFGYEAAKPSKARKTVKVDMRSEDRVLSKKERRVLHSRARDLKRNMAAAAWAIRTHCAHVAQHTFQARTDNPQLNRDIERLMTDWSRADHCDAAGRHSLSRLIYLAEAARVEVGDVLAVFTDDGKLQLIEGDRIDNPQIDAPKDFDAAQFVHGVQIGESGEAKTFIVNRRDKKGKLIFVGKLDADEVHQHGYFDRLDQVRGVSPLAAALNHFQDIHEAQGYALAKAKIAQQLILKLMHGEVSEEDKAEKSIKLDGSPQVVDLYDEESADLMHVDTPGTSFQEYMRQMLMCALKALDLDFSFFDSSHTNYSGARQALLMYRRSARIRQEEVQSLLAWITRRKLDQWAKENLITLPAGVESAQDLAFEWVPVGIGWVDPLKEVRAQIAALEAGLTSRQQIVRERDGGDWLDTADQLQTEQDALAERGLTVSTESAAKLVAPTPQEQAEEAEEAASELAQHNKDA